MKNAYFLIGLLALTNASFAMSKGELPGLFTGKVYVGIFGGGGSSNNFDIDQYGTAFYTEAEGGPLAVNAFGQADDHSLSFGGAQLGYQAQPIVLSPGSQWSLAPAVELEGYYTNKSSFTETLSNNTDRLPEHDFSVTYPMRRTVFLTNIILTLNHPRIVIHPYIGVGVGGAIVQISNATSTQIAPPEPDINHYNANTSDEDTTFSGQIKVGLSYDIIKAITLFAEYRWLYLSSTDFTFGSTVYPGHPATSSWHVDMDPQKYNMGSAGIRFNL